jgi:hypothetical protein
MAGTRMRWAVMRGAVSCRRRQSPRRRCPADGRADRPAGSLAGLRYLPMTALRNWISACEQVPGDAARARTRPDRTICLRVRQPGITAGPPRSHRSSCSTSTGPAVGLQPVEVVSSPADGREAFRAGATGQTPERDAGANRASDAVTGGPRAHGPNELGGPPATAAPLRSHLISDVGDCRGVTPTHQPTLRPILAFPKCSSRGISPRS